MRITSYSAEEIAQAIRYLRTGELPSFPPKNAERSKLNWTARLKDAQVRDGRLYVGDKRVVPQNEVPELLRAEYYSLQNGGFVGAERFWKTLCARYIGIRYEDVKQFVGAQEVAQTHRPAIQHRVVRPLRANFPMETIQLDTTQYGEIFILTAIDLYSRFAWVLMKRSAMNGEAVKQLLEKIIAENGIPTRVQTDNGAEFKNKTLEEFLAKQGIRHVFSLPYRSTSQGAVERFNKTLKHLLARFEEASGAGLTAAILTQALQGYNSTYHSGISGIPQDVFQKRQKPKTSRPKVDEPQGPDIKPNDWVRVALNALETDVRADKNRKGYLQQFSSDVYRVFSVGRPRKESLTARAYTLSLNGHIIRRPFYRGQLLKVPSPTPEKTHVEAPANIAEAERIKYVPKARQRKEPAGPAKLVANYRPGNIRRSAEVRDLEEHGPTLSTKRAPKPNRKYM